MKYSFLDLGQHRQHRTMVPERRGKARCNTWKISRLQQKERNPNRSQSPWIEETGFWSMESRAEYQRRERCGDVPLNSSLISLWISMCVWESYRGGERTARKEQGQQFLESHRTRNCSCSHQLRESPLIHRALSGLQKGVSLAVGTNYPY